MPTYHFHLENSSGPAGNADSREFTDDQGALREASAAAGEVLLSELAEGMLTPQATVTVERDGTPIAVVKATATVERFD